ncbi:hypothetical protein DFH28DRAFT_1092888 [Melampsora americana]|nr:hypothetical protein DFH28DRAFT_1092888 [Melampsora americana]
MTTISTSSPSPKSTSYASLPNSIKITVFVCVATLVFVVLSLLLSLCVLCHRRRSRTHPSSDIPLSNIAPRPSSTVTINTLPPYASRDLTLNIQHNFTDFQRPPSYATRNSDITDFTAPGQSAQWRGFSIILDPTYELDEKSFDLLCTYQIAMTQMAHELRRIFYHHHRDKN